VRQQAQAIYRKAALPGKTAFSAYFLEGLFTPDAVDAAVDGRVAAPAAAAALAPEAGAAAEPQPVGGNPRSDL
jgi:hypothetical protein